MEQSTNREKVLKKLRSALLHKTPNPYPNLDFERNVFTENDPLPEITFVEKFEAAGGKVLLCETNYELAEDIILICRQNNFKDIFCVDAVLSSLLDDLNFQHHSIFDRAEDKNPECAVVNCDCVVAATGSIVFASLPENEMLLASLAKNLIVVARTVEDTLKSALQQVKEKNSGKLPAVVSLVTGNGNLGLENDGATVYVILIATS